MRLSFSRDIIVVLLIALPQNKQTENKAKQRKHAPPKTTTTTTTKPTKQKQKQIKNPRQQLQSKQQKPKPQIKTTNKIKIKSKTTTTTTNPQIAPYRSSKTQSKAKCCHAVGQVCLSLHLDTRLNDHDLHSRPWRCEERLLRQSSYGSPPI